MKITSPEQIQNKRFTHEAGQPRKRRIDTSVTPEEALASFRRNSIIAPLAESIRRIPEVTQSDEAYREHSLTELIASRQPTAAQRLRSAVENERRAAKGLAGLALVICGLTLATVQTPEVQDAYQHYKDIPAKTARTLKNALTSIADYLEMPQQKNLDQFAQEAQEFRAKRGMP